jgi:hypothetical protein
LYVYGKFVRLRQLMTRIEAALIITDARLRAQAATTLSEKP